jgi:hypothetical protein
MRHRLIEIILEVGLTLIVALGLLSSESQAAEPPIHIDAELVTGQVSDTASVDPAALAQPLTMKFKNGSVQFTLSDQTDKTIRIHAQIFEQASSKPVYNATFLTNLNMDAEIREMRQDGSLLYKLKVTPRTPQDKK